jgi:hypothetical protein
MKLSKLALLVGTLAVIVNSCRSAEVKSRVFYLSVSGDDNESGSLDHPWKTIQRLNSQGLRGGDTVFFWGGEGFTGSIRVDSLQNGNAGSPLVLTSYGPRQAEILSGPDPGLQIGHSEFIDISRLRFRGSGRKSANSGDGVSISYCNHIQVDSLEITGYQKAGLFIFCSSFVNSRHVYAHENGFAGISVMGKNAKTDCQEIYIGYSKAEDNPGDPAIVDNHSGNGIVAGFCRKVCIEYSSATGNGWDMPRIGNGPVGIWAYEADSVTIQHCISYRNKTSSGGGDGGGYDLDGGVTNSVIQYCLSYENQGSGFGIFQYAGASAWHDNTIRFNISEDDGNVSAAQAAVFIWNSSGDPAMFSNCNFYNNTIYNARGAALSYDPQSIHREFRFCNNLFVGKDSLIRGKFASSFFSGNDWWCLRPRSRARLYTAIPENREPGVKGWHIDPAFRNPGNCRQIDPVRLGQYADYAIPPASPLRSGGKDIQAKFGARPGLPGFTQGKVPSGAVGAVY